MDFFIVISLFFIAVATEDRLISVNIVIRHSDRASSFGTITERAPIVFFRGADELSDEGIDNAFIQGLAFKKRYVDSGFIDARYLPSEVYVKSSPVNRCLMSAASFTKALFNLTNFQNTVVPPIYTENKETDWMLYPHIECPDGWDDVKERFKLSATSDFPMNIIPPLLASDWPCTIPGADFDAIICEGANLATAFSMSFPFMPQRYMQCARGPAQLFMKKYIETLAGADRSFNEVRIKRVAGLLTRKLIDNFEEAASCTSPPCNGQYKFNVFYTHDVTELAIADIFGVAGAFHDYTPAFSSALIFETRRKSDGTTYVKIILKNGIYTSFVDTDNCAKDCSVAAVTAAVSPFALSDPMYCIDN